MMSMREQYILDQFRQLDSDAQRRVLDLLEQEAAEAPFDYAAWFAEVEAYHNRLRLTYGADHVFGSEQVLNDIREEGSVWPRPS